MKRLAFYLVFVGSWFLPQTVNAALRLFRGVLADAIANKKTIMRQTQKRDRERSKELGTFLCLVTVCVHA